MTVVLISSAVIDRRYRRNFVIERFGLKASAVATRTNRVSAITAEQNAHVHFISFAFEPAEESAHAVPAVVFIIVINAIRSFLAVDHEVLVGFRKFFERNANVD